MKTSKLLFICAIASASLAGCEGGSGGSGSRTVTKIANQEINRNTAEDSVPIEINDLPISDRDTDESSEPGSLN